MKLYLIMVPIALAILTGCDRSDSESRDNVNDLSIWEQVSITLPELSKEQSKQLVQAVLARHGTVASDANIKDMVGALLRFQDSSGVDPVRVLECMNSGVRSPTGRAWQDTMAFCVVELQE